MLKCILLTYSALLLDYLTMLISLDGRLLISNGIFFVTFFKNCFILLFICFLNLSEVEQIHFISKWLTVRNTFHD